MASQAGKDTLLRLIREGKPLSFGQQLQLTFTLSLPAILANASAMVMQFIDAAMVGQLGADDSASVGLMGSTNWLFEGVLSAFAAGYAVQVAQLLGAKRDRDARQVVRQAFCHRGPREEHPPRNGSCGFRCNTEDVCRQVNPLPKCAPLPGGAICSKFPCSR